jgi:hypothetical protein
VQQAPLNDVPLGQPASPGIMQAPPENWVRTQTSVAAQVADPHAGPDASLGVPEPPLVLQPATPAPSATATANANIINLAIVIAILPRAPDRRALSAGGA